MEALPEGATSRLMREFMYGTGMRVGEVCTLRVRDIDLGRAQMIVRAANGDKDRIVMLPRARECAAWRWSALFGAGVRCLALFGQARNGLVGRIVSGWGIVTVGRSVRPEWLGEQGLCERRWRAVV